MNRIHSMRGRHPGGSIDHLEYLDGHGFRPIEDLVVARENSRASPRPLLGKKVMLEPKQSGFSRVEPIAPPQRVGDFQRVTMDQDETGVAPEFVEYVAPERDQFANSWILDAPQSRRPEIPRNSPRKHGRRPCAYPEYGAQAPRVRGTSTPRTGHRPRAAGERSSLRQAAHA